jgi:FOG: CheY-like receiver
MKPILIHGDETPVSESIPLDYMHFTSIVWEKVMEAELVIIVSEPSNTLTSPTAFFGFEILKSLRIKHEILAPVLLLSAFSKSYFLQSKNKDFKILITPGHYLASIPYQLDKLCKKEYDRLDASTLHDITRNIFAFEGAIQEELHRLKNSIYTLEDNKTHRVESLSAVETLVSTHLTNIEHILDLSYNTNFTTLKQDILTEIKTQFAQHNTVKGLIKVIQSNEEKLKAYLPNSDKNDDGPKTAIETWEALYVEDTPKIAKDVQLKLQDRGVLCHTVKNAEQAFEVLNKDHTNKITVLICDYRLVEKMDGFEVWQTKQGYNILEDAYKNLNNFVALFLLTFFDKGTLLKIQRTHKMKVWSYAKDDILHSNIEFDAFAKRVIDEGTKYHDLVCSQPTSKVWTKGYKNFNRPYKEYYRMHRLAEDFETAELEISQKSETFFDYIKALKYGNSAEQNIPAYGFRDGIGNEKNVSLSKEEEVERFRIKLIGRRIAIALHDTLSLKRSQIFFAMTHRQFEKSPKTNDNQVNQFFTTFLALSLNKDIPKRLLPEERSWLKTISDKPLKS